MISSTIRGAAHDPGRVRGGGPQLGRHLAQACGDGVDRGGVLRAAERRLEVDDDQEAVTLLRDQGSRGGVLDAVRQHQRVDHGGDAGDLGKLGARGRERVGELGRGGVDLREHERERRAALVGVLEDRAALGALRAGCGRLARAEPLEQGLAVHAEHREAVPQHGEHEPAHDDDAG